MHGRINQHKKRPFCFVSSSCWMMMVFDMVHSCCQHKPSVESVGIFERMGPVS